MSIWNITELGEVTSTSMLAKERVQAGVGRHGEVWQAEHQTQGRGRIPGRVWSDTPGESLLLSIVLLEMPTPPEGLQHLVALSVLVALRQIAEESGVDPFLFRLKFPNDILIQEQKVCGILTEAIWHGEEMRGAVVGIGLNVRQHSFDGLIERSATSLWLAGIKIEVNQVRHRILDILEHDLARYATMSLPEAHALILDLVRAEFTEENLPVATSRV